LKQNNLLKLFIVMIIIAVILLAGGIWLRLNCKPMHMVIPVEFMYKYPDCTNKLIETANLTNVHILPPWTLDTRKLRSP